MKEKNIKTWSIMRVLRKVGLTGGKGLKSITTLQWCFIPVIPYFPETQQFDYAA